jgi:putative FmdB family regulatory protein
MYDYQCRSCGTVTEVIHSMLESGPTTCERCGGALRRVIFPSGIIFKGSGFYSTDSRSGKKSASTTPAIGAGSDGSGSSDSSGSSTSPSSGGSESSPESSPGTGPKPKSGSEGA